MDHQQINLPLAGVMSEAEKQTVIKREFDLLYYPQHPVRNHLGTLGSAKEVKTMREALK